MLNAVSASLGDIARKVGCGSRQTVADWRKGEKVPGGPFRLRLQEEYSIPVEAWDRQPATGRPAPATTRPSSSPDASAAAAAKHTTLEQCLALIGDTEAELAADRDRATGDPESAAMPLSSGERVKLRDTLAKLLGLRHRLESAGELLEDRLVRQHPAWKRFKARLLKALVPYPDASRAVLAALQELGEEDQAP